MCSSTSYFTGPNKIVPNSRMFVSVVTSGVTHLFPLHSSGLMNAVGTEWVTPGVTNVPRMECLLMFPL